MKMKAYSQRQLISTGSGDVVRLSLSDYPAVLREAIEFLQKGLFMTARTVLETFYRGYRQSLQEYMQLLQRTACDENYCRANNIVRNEIGEILFTLDIRFNRSGSYQPVRVSVDMSSERDSDGRRLLRYEIVDTTQGG